MGKIWAFDATRGVVAYKVNPDIDFKDEAVVQWWFHNLRVASCELRVVGCDFKKNKFMSGDFLFTSCKVILRVANLLCELEIKLRVAS